MKIRIIRITAAVLLIAWMSVIFTLSAQPAKQSSGVSGGFTEKVCSVFYPGFNELDQSEQNEVVANLQRPVRKAAHFTVYFILGIISSVLFVTVSRFPLFLRAVFSLAVCILYAVSDEIHQYFVPGRSCRAFDVLIDSAGAFLAILILFITVSKTPLINLFEKETNLNGR